MIPNYEISNIVDGPPDDALREDSQLTESLRHVYILLYSRQCRQPPINLWQASRHIADIPGCIAPQAGRQSEVVVIRLKVAT